MLYMVSGINKIVNKEYGKREKRETRFDPVLKGLINLIYLDRIDFLISNKFDQTVDPCELLLTLSALHQIWRPFCHTAYLQFY